MFFAGSYGLTSYLYEFFMTLVYVAPAVLLAISMHEFAHGYMSYKLGDMTPKLDGRLTLNPAKHLDVWGTLCLLFFHVGWAKPVRVNTRNYKNPKRDFILVAAAGPVMNFILAFVFMILYGVILKFGTSGVIINYLYVFSYYAAKLNIGLGIFNLIPIPPLDGSNILAGLIPEAERFYKRIRPYRTLVILLILGVFSLPVQRIDNAIFDGLLNLVKTILRIGVTAGTGGGSGTIV